MVKKRKRDAIDDLLEERQPRPRHRRGVISKTTGKRINAAFLKVLKHLRRDLESTNPKARAAALRAVEKNRALLERLAR